jgi:sugar porter (SP) family MFS transporter
MQKPGDYKLSFITGISLISAMGGFMFGYDWVVIGGAEPFYKAFFGITDSPGLQGIAMGSALPGCLTGALAAGFLSDALGRKKTLILSALIFIVSSFGVGYANTLTGFILWRLTAGLGIGLASVVSPVYIAEVSPGEYRGRFVSLNQLTIVIGILAAQILNYMIAERVPEGASDEWIRQSWNGQTGWRWMFWVMTIPSGIFLILLFILPESPRWLMKCDRHEDGMRVLHRIGPVDWAQDQAEAIRASLLEGRRQKNTYRMLFSSRFRPVLILGLVLAVFQQWCGINVVFNYAADIFRAAGFGVSDALFNIVVTGTVNLVFTFVAIRTIDSLGRRKLMLLGSSGLAIAYLFLGASLHFQFGGAITLLFILLAIAIYAMNLAPVTWVILSEIFPNSIRGLAMSTATSSLWMACFIIVYTFPWLNRSLQASGTFWLYTSICIAGSIFVFLRLPETRGKSLEELEKQFTRPGGGVK